VKDYADRVKTFDVVGRNRPGAHHNTERTVGRTNLFNGTSSFGFETSWLGAQELHLSRRLCSKGPAPRTHCPCPFVRLVVRSMRVAATVLHLPGQSSAAYVSTWPFIGLFSHDRRGIRYFLHAFLPELLLFMSLSFSHSQR